MAEEEADEQEAEEESAQKAAVDEEKVVKHPKKQVETLLSEPILIPRNPISMNVRFILIVFVADFLFALLCGMLLGVIGYLGITPGPGVWVLIVMFLVARITLLMIVLMKLSANWSEETYYMTERQLIHKRGIANVYEDTYELSNIRNVYMFQDFVGRMYDYGHIHLTIATRGMTDVVQLTDIKSPGHYKTIFEKYLG